MTEASRAKRNSSRLEQCHPRFAARLARVIAHLEASGLRPRIQDAWRSPADQLAAFNSGHSQLKFGFHNFTTASGAPDSLAVDLLDDNNPLRPSVPYLLQLAAAARDEGLETGILWGLASNLKRGTEAAIAARNFSAKVKVGWDPTHVQPAGITLAEAEAGKRPT